MSALSNQTEAAAILREIARATWPKAHDDAACPDNRVPTVEELGAAVLPFEAVKEAVARSSAAVDAPDLQLMIVPDGASAPPMPGGLALYSTWLPVRTARPDLAPPPDPERPGGTIEAVHAAWSALPDGERGRHPLAPLVAAWQQHAPVHVPAVTDYDRPLILSRQFATVRDDAEGYYLQRFNTAAHRAGGQLLLGFEHPEMEGPTLPADVWSMQLADAEKRGPGLPAALRIFLASIVHVPLAARASADPSTPPVMLMGPDGRPWTLRHFLGLIYDADNSLPRPNRYWPVLWGAREVLHSVEMPYQWNGRIWSRPVLRMDWPQSVSGGYETSMLDEPWPVSVHLPPGDGNGAPVNWGRLRQYMTRDAAAARALVNLAYRWHIEGKRLMPAPGKAAHWLQRRDPKVYDRITDRLAEQLCFPPGTGKERRRARIADARAALERLVKNGDAVSVDGRLLPPLPPAPHRGRQPRGVGARNVAESARNVAESARNVAG